MTLSRHERRMRAAKIGGITFGVGRHVRPPAGECGPLERCIEPACSRARGGGAPSPTSAVAPAMEACLAGFNIGRGAVCIAPTRGDAIGTRQRVRPCVPS